MGGWKQEWRREGPLFWASPVRLQPSVCGLDELNAHAWCGIHRFGMAWIPMGQTRQKQNERKGASEWGLRCVQKRADLWLSANASALAETRQLGVAP